MLIGEVVIPGPTDEENQVLQVQGGELTFLIGPNGAGKSTLLQSFHRQDVETSYWISALRQNWFGSSRSNLSPTEAERQRRNRRGKAQQEIATRRDEIGSGQWNTLLHELPEEEDKRARQGMRFVDEGHPEKAMEFSLTPSPSAKLNRVLGNAGLGFEVFIDDDRSVSASKDGQTFPVEMLSDGERNALLLASEIILVPEGAHLLVDEPERHLHRAAITPLITALRVERPDLAMTFATHDLDLVDSFTDARVVVVHDHVKLGRMPNKFIATVLGSRSDLDDNVREAILGGRRNVVVIEGVRSSLDQRLYRLLFPGVTILPAENCREVERVVKGLRNAPSLHWLNVYGIVDQDRRTEAEKEGLWRSGILAVPAYSVESIYYHPILREAAAKAMEEMSGQPAEAALAMACANALEVLKQGYDHLATKSARTRLRQQLMAQLPDGDYTSFDGDFKIAVDAKALFEAERTRLQTHLDSGDLNAIVAQYPIKETGVPNAIARAFKFTSHDHYVDSVIRQLGTRPDLLARVQSLYEPLKHQVTPVSTTSNGDGAPEA